MARKIRPPKYAHHKASGQTRVRIDGTDHYLGHHGTPESHREYARLVDEWMAKQTGPRVRLTVGQLTLKFMRYAEAYYVKNGKQTSEVHRCRESLKRLNQVAKDVPVDELAPRHIKAARDRMIADGLARTTVNCYTQRMRLAVKWGVAEEFVQVAVLNTLQALGDLRQGRSLARETDPG